MAECLGYCLRAERGKSHPATHKSLSGLTDMQLASGGCSVVYRHGKRFAELQSVDD